MKRQHDERPLTIRPVRPSERLNDDRVSRRLAQPFGSKSSPARTLNGGTEQGQDLVEEMLERLRQTSIRGRSRLLSMQTHKQIVRRSVREQDWSVRREHEKAGSLPPSPRKRKGIRRAFALCHDREHVMSCVHGVPGIERLVVHA
jgi:hypothetical protein